MKNKWKKLSKYLEKSNKEEVILSFDNIEKIIHAKLPEETLKTEWWWNRQDSEIAKCWLAKGYKTIKVKDTIDQEFITFIRIRNVNLSEKKSHLQRVLNFFTNVDNSFRKKIAAIVVIFMGISSFAGGIYTVKSYYENQKNSIIKSNKFNEYYEFGEQYLKEKKYSDAIKYFELSINTYDNLNIPYDTDSIKSFISLAEIYGKIGLYNKALNYYIEVMSIMDSLNIEKESYLKIYISIGYTYLELTELEKAEQYFDKAIKFFDKDEILTFDQLILYIFLQYYNIDEIYGTKMDSKLFEENFLNTDINKLGWYLELRSLEASIDMFKGEYKTAVLRFGQIVSFYDYLYMCNFLDNKLKIAALYDSISMCYIQLGYTENAKEYNQHAIDIFNNVYGIRNIETGISYCNFGMTCLSMKEYEIAYEYLRKSAAIIQDTIGDNNELIATVYNNIGLYFSYTDNYEDAEKYYLMSLNIYEKLSISSIGLARLYLNYSVCLIDMNKIDEANMYVANAYSLVSILVDEDAEEYQLYEEVKKRLQSITSE